MNIKVRAWQPDGSCYKYESLEEIHSDGYLGGKADFSDCELFTGLKDKNGVEIYEGDIVGRHGEQVWTVEYDESRARFIAYNQLNSSRDIEESMTKMTIVDGVHEPVVIISVTDEIEIEAEVIGNIHENPELLETQA